MTQALVSLPVILFAYLGKEQWRSRLFFSHITAICSHKEISYSQVGGTRRRQGENERTLISHSTPQIYGVVMLPWHNQAAWILRQFQLFFGVIRFSNRRKQKTEKKNLINNYLLKVK